MKSLAIGRRLMAALAIFGLFLLVSPATASAQQPASTTNFSEMEKSILLVGTTWEGYVQFYTDENGWEWTKEPVQAFTMCTGWFASTDAHVVTAGHCVDPQRGRSAILRSLLRKADAMSLLDKAEANWKVEGGTQGSPPARTVQVVQLKEVGGAVITDPTTAQVVDFKPFDEGDVALLKVPNVSTQTPALAVANAAPQIGASLTSIGFPGSVSSVVDASRQHATFMSGRASSQQSTPSGLSVTGIDAAVSGGMSGGPTVDEFGNVLGVNSFGINGETQSFNFITNPDDLGSFLKANDISPLPAKSAAKPASESRGGENPSGLRPAAAEESSDNSTLWIIVVVVVVLVGLGVGFVLFRRHRSKQSVTCFSCRRSNSAASTFCNNCGETLMVQPQQPPMVPGPFS